MGRGVLVALILAILIAASIGYTIRSRPIGRGGGEAEQTEVETPGGEISGGEAETSEEMETSGEMAEKPTGQVEEKVEEEVELPIYPGAMRFPIPPEFWAEMNVSGGKEGEAYLVKAKMDEVVSWYRNLKDWSLMRNGTEIEEKRGLQLTYLIYRRNETGLLVSIIQEPRIPEGHILLTLISAPWPELEHWREAPEVSETSEESEEEVFQLFYEYPELGEGPVIFKTCPLDFDAIAWVEPLGNLNPPGHTFPSDHGGFVLKDPDRYPPPYTVRAPAAGIIVEIQWRVHDWPPESGFRGKYNDYKVVIAHTSTFMSAIDHISELDENILRRAGNLTVGFNRVEIPVEEGEILGKAGGRPGVVAGIDWCVYDKNVTRNFIHLEKYGRSVHAAHFLPYCDEELRAKLMAKLKRTAEPRWGKFDYDQPGKLVGNWFCVNVSESEEVDWYRHLSFVYDMYDPDSIRIAVGGTLPMEVGVYAVYGNSPDPAEVTVESGKVVYWLMNAPDWDRLPRYTMIVELLDNETLRVEVFEGWIENPEFTNQTYIYTR